MHYLTPLHFSPTPTEHLISIQLQSECHELGHDPSAQFILYKANDLLVSSHAEEANPAVAIAAHAEPSLNVTSDGFVEIVSLDVENERVSVHVTQPKICTILWLHVVVMELIHDSLTQIEDGLPEVDDYDYYYYHYDSDLFHLAPHQVLTEDNSWFEVQFHHCLEIHLLVCLEIDIPMLPDVLHHLPRH